jgi:hypothetical protein
MRAFTFAGSSVCLALAAHTAAGGHRPGTILLGCAVALLTRVAYGLAGRERGLGAVLVGVGLTQLALHATFAVTSHGTGMAAQTLLPRGITMTAAHVTAAGLVATLLSQAEHALWTAATLRVAVARFRSLSRATGLLVCAARRFTAALCMLLTSEGDASRAWAAKTPGRPRPTTPAPSVSLAGSLFARAGRRRGPPLAHPALPAAA